MTGAAQGIGAAVVLALSRAGAIVAALDIQAVCAGCQAEGLAVQAYPVDQIEAELGPVAILVNAAGI